MKTVAFAKVTKPTTPDEWVTAGPTEQQAARPTEPIKRITVDIPASLHQRVKVGCALRQTNISDVLREILEREFPPSGNPPM
jgi:hypothetical protein